MTSPRVARGRRTEVKAAEYLRDNGFIFAEHRPASLPGSDIFGIPGVDIEIKATESNALISGLRQSIKRAPDAELNICIYRPRGMGETAVGDWIVSMTFAQFVQLMKGYGL